MIRSLAKGDIDNFIVTYVLFVFICNVKLKSFNCVVLLSLWRIAAANNK